MDPKKSLVQIGCRHLTVFVITVQLYNTIQYNTNSISNAPPTPTVDRERITVQFTVQFWSSAVNKKVSSLRLNSGVERTMSQFHCYWAFTRSDRRTDWSARPRLRSTGRSDQSDRPVGQTVAEPPTTVNQINVAC